jgi:pimeloyl-ACP methyl ester carboxylesterase
MFKHYLAWLEPRLAAEDEEYKLVEPMEPGLELLTDDRNATADWEAVREFGLSQAARSDEFYQIDESGVEYACDGEWLWFPSPIPTETPGNNRAGGRVFETKRCERAVVILPHWNATGASYDRFAVLLRRAGIASVRLSLPYHDGRNAEGLKLSTLMVSANLGRTIRSCRQAVLEARLAVGWLRRRGYERIGIVGTSLGSSIAAITAAHETRIKAAALILMASHFGEVVWSGRATRHIRRMVEGRLSLEQLVDVWSVISPETYVRRLADRQVPLLVLSGRMDEVFPPHLTRRFIDQLGAHGVPHRWKSWNCGHYTMGTLPISLHVFGTVLRFLKANL